MELSNSPQPVNTPQSEEAKLKQEVKLLREVLAKCLKARQINHVRQIIKEMIK